MYVRALTAEQINNAVTDTTINDAVTAQTVNDLVTSQTINDAVTAQTVNDLVTSQTINDAITADTVNGLVDRGFVRAGEATIPANDSRAVLFDSTVVGAVAAFKSTQNVGGECTVSWNGETISIRNGSSSQQVVAWVAVVDL